MAKMKVCWGLATAVLALPAPALAEVKLEGYFIARTKCPAFQSVRKQSNLGDVYTQAGRVYELRGKNKEPGSHYKIRIDGQPPDRWVAMNCGEHVVPMGADGQRGSASRSDATSNCGGSGRACFQEMSVVLAVSWQPAFCERHPSKRECKTQAPDRFDANHFALHGLWPDGVYCGVSDEIMGKDKTNKWDQLPPLALSQTLRRELLKKMPGMLSGLHRHEWIKHGTCYGDATPQKYFEDSLRFLDALNRSSVRTMFEEQTGQHLRASDVRAAFDQAFGPGAGSKVIVKCGPDESRTLIVELQLSLRGNLATDQLENVLCAADCRPVGCDGGVVDAVGLQ